MIRFVGKDEHIWQAFVLQVTTGITNRMQSVYE